MKELLEKIANELIAGKKEKITRTTQEALDKGVTAKEILDDGLLAGMDVVGPRFKVGDMFIPEVLQSAACMHAAMDIITPLLSEADTKGIGTYVIGTVEGDAHDIGKNMVSMMLKGAGFKVIDLGIGITAQQFVDAAKKYHPEVLGMSALLTTTMPKMKDTIQAIEEAGIRNQIKIMLGGAPVNQEFVDEIGADAFGANAATAVEKAKELIK